MIPRLRQPPPYTLVFPATARTSTSRSLPSSGPLREYAERNGYIVVREYVDEAESGRVADRPEFRKMLDEGLGR